MIARRCPSSSWPASGTVSELSLRSEEPALRAEWRLGVRATGLDAGTRTLRCDDGEVEPFDGIVIATGAAPRRLGTRALAGLHVLRTVGESETLHAELALTPGRVAIIGAGFIGAEVAATCRGLGSRSPSSRRSAAPLENVVGWLVGGAVADLHRDHGVDLRLGVAVAAIAGEERVDAGWSSATAPGSTPTSWWWRSASSRTPSGWRARGSRSTAACCATRRAWPPGGRGRRRRRPLAQPPLRRGAAGRALGERDPAGRARGPAAAGQGAGGAVEPYTPVPWFWSDQYDRKLQLAGSPAGAEEVHVIAVGEGRMLALYRRGERLVAVFSLSQGRAMVRYRRLLDQDPRG